MILPVKSAYQICMMMALLLLREHPGSRIDEINDRRKRCLFFQDCDCARFFQSQ